MMLFPQMMQQLNQQTAQQQLQPKVLCPFCGNPNDYPYRFCGNCGKPSPQMQQQQAPPQPAAAPKSFKNCPYCGEDLSGLPKTPKFCPYCAEQLS